MGQIGINILEKKNIALVAHDNMKKELIEWISDNKEVLKKHTLFGTGTTASIIEERLNLEVEAFKSGPMGGDQQLGAKISEGQIDLMIFFWDPLEAQPHDPDVKALLRIAVLYDIPVANNRATADFILSSPLMNEEYKRHIIDYSSLIKERRKHFLDII
ncbi:methylglyoxal synthase [Tissierella creatinophila]|uniref:Methylglyoxal synthase n=1 Tax=Tissierella creatinophila DSM 6911 TaxID=1123403 RepID=A0A1U7M6G6_TISCR|nr:methylglyoxal synthase [Tissierella creatinophila]OLS02788.1 methylglyoxal synthase [Tissierella creatinophila DSM 6911]